MDEFRALGGAIDNVQLADGPLGRGLFVIDPARPLLIRIPERLLVNSSDIVFENNALKLAPSVALEARERKFYEDYYAQLSWGGGGRAEIERIFDQAQALPPELRQKLLATYRCGEWFLDPTPELIQSHFIHSRKIGHHARDVMMPFVELANHGDGRSYEGELDLSINGVARDEITVRYSNADPYGLFRSWGFSCEEDIAYSMELEGSIGGRPLLIECSPDWAAGADRPGYPKISRDGDSVKLSLCMLGNRKFPRLCRGNFRHVLREAGFGDVDETFDKVRRTNQMVFLSLLADLEDLKGAMVQSLRRMARLQLQALTHCYGARETPPAPRAA